MNDKKPRRFPADREKLHALRKKKEQELAELREEVEELQARCQEADRTAIHATVEMYNISVDELKAFLREKFGDQVIPEMPVAITVPDNNVKPTKEEEPPDDEK